MGVVTEKSDARQETRQPIVAVGAAARAVPLLRLPRSQSRFSAVDLFSIGPPPSPNSVPRMPPRLPTAITTTQMFGVISQSWPPNVHDP